MTATLSGIDAEKSPPTGRSIGLEDEGELLRRYAETRSPELRDELVNRFLPLARSLAMRYRRRSESLEDLVQVASVGLTEAKAKERGYDIKVGRFPFIGNGKAIALGEPEGLIKTIFDAKTGELLGAHMVGAEVTELIQGYVVGRALETTEEDLMNTVFPHPTLSEMMHEAVLDAYGRAIHY